MDTERRHHIRKVSLNRGESVLVPVLRKDTSRWRAFDRAVQTEPNERGRPDDEPRHDARVRSIVNQASDAHASIFASRARRSHSRVAARSLR